VSDAPGLACLKRNAAGAFIVISPLTAARLKDADNAAHIGGAGAPRTPRRVTQCITVMRLEP